MSEDFGKLFASGALGNAGSADVQAGSFISGGSGQGSSNDKLLQAQGSIDEAMSTLIQGADKTGPFRSADELLQGFSGALEQTPIDQLEGGMDYMVTPQAKGQEIGALQQVSGSEIGNANPGNLSGEANLKPSRLYGSEEGRG